MGRYIDHGCKINFTEVSFLGEKYPEVIVRGIILGGNFPGAVI